MIGRPTGNSDRDCPTVVGKSLTAATFTLSLALPFRLGQQLASRRIKEFLTMIVLAGASTRIAWTMDALLDIFAQDGFLTSQAFALALRRGSFRRCSFGFSLSL